jgi:hypothetical protein
LESSHPATLRAGFEKRTGWGVSEEEIKWEGDMEDDCSAMVGNLTAHCEALGEFFAINDEDEDETMKCDYWHCAVYDQASGKTLFHAGEIGGFVISGDLARGICEAVIRAYFTHPSPGDELKNKEVE